MNNKMFELTPTKFTWLDTFPEMSAATGDWTQLGCVEKDCILCGHSGKLEEREFASGGLRYTACHFQADDESFHAFRARLQNTAGESVEVQKVYMLSFTCNHDSREYYCMKRLKTEKPYSAVYHGEDFDADNVVVFHSDGKLLLFGFLDQHRHLAAISMRDSESSDYFNKKRLSAFADYQGTLLEAGKTWETQWCEVCFGDNFNELMALHASRAPDASGIEPRHLPAPFVASSWHFFGGHIGEEMLASQLDAIRDRNIPAEVYQLDGGWYEDIGDWTANKTKFPHGMKFAADMISRAGMVPGIWLAPFIICEESPVAKAHPEWMLRNRDGELVKFRCSRPCVALDLSRQDVLDFIEKNYRDLREMGYMYFKADFTQALLADPNPALHDRTMNIVECFRNGLSAIRRGIGEDSFFNLCGGHTGAAMGIADSQRTGHDTYARWQSDNPTPAWHRIRQTMLRSWMGAWRLNDPDAIAIRVSSDLLDDTPYGTLSLGDMNDDEARTMVLHQFIAGGTVAIGENCRTLDESRLRMIRKVAPAAGCVASLLDPFNSRCPERFITHISAKPGNPDGFSVYSQINTTDETVFCMIRLTSKIVQKCRSGKFVVADADSPQILGIFDAGDEVRADDIPPHGCRVLRIVPVPDKAIPFPVVSDGHYAGTELTEFSPTDNGFSVKMNNPWRQDLRLTVAIPKGKDWSFFTMTLRS